MKKGWYKNSVLSLQIRQAKIWADTYGYTGDEKREQVRLLVMAGLEDY